MPAPACWAKFVRKLPQGQSCKKTKYCCGPMSGCAAPPQQGNPVAMPQFIGRDGPQLCQPICGLDNKVHVTTAKCHKDDEFNGAMVGTVKPEGEL
jgi:hypothetical protein